MKRGEVWMVDIRPRSGSEQSGVRPAVLISSDGFNSTPSWSSLIVVPVSTSATQQRRLRTVVPLSPGSGGLRRESVALCHQITTLDRSKFGQRLGELDAPTITAIEEGIKAALDFPR